MASPIIATMGADVSPAAYADAEGNLVTTPPAPRLELHEFRADAEGRLVHSIGGILRATVPPEGFEDYARTWPAAEAVIKQIAAKSDTPAAQSEDPEDPPPSGFRAGRRR